MKAIGVATPDGTHAMTPAPDALAAARELADTIKRRIDIRMNDHLCEMKSGFDDSIASFNKTWTIVRDIFAETLATAPPSPELRRATEDARALRAALVDARAFLFRASGDFAIMDKEGRVIARDGLLAAIDTALAQKETGGE